MLEIIRIRTPDQDFGSGPNSPWRSLRTLRSRDALAIIDAARSISQLIAATESRK